MKKEINFKGHIPVDLLGYEYAAIYEDLLRLGLLSEDSNHTISVLIDDEVIDITYCLDAFFKLFFYI